jgi:hypothetical protein
MNRAKVLMAVLGLGSAGSAMAGPTIALGHPLGLTLGNTLGDPLGHVLGGLLGLPLGDTLPVGSAAFVLAAVSLGVGIYIARRKRHR